MTRHRSTAATAVPTTASPIQESMTFMNTGSLQMHTMYEALAREHMREREAKARQRRLVSELAAANRWRYLERRAHAAAARHAHRAARAIEASAVAE